MLSSLRILRKAGLDGISRHIIILLILTVLVSVILPRIHAADPDLNVEHTIDITENGLILVNDRVSLYNDGSRDIASFKIGFHQDFSNHLNNATALTDRGDRVRVVKRDLDQESNLQWMALELPQALGLDQTLNLTINLTFSELITYSSLDPTNYTATFPLYPALDWMASSCTVRINLPSGSELIEGSWGNSTTLTKSPLEENADQKGTAIFQGPLQYLECSSLNREVVIDSWGHTVSKDEYVIRNVGKDEIAVVDLPLPGYVGVIEAYDDLGSLTADLSDEDGERRALVTCRYPLRGEVNGVPFHDSYTFTIQYRLKTGENSTQNTSLSSYRSRIFVLPSPDWCVQAMEVKIVLPEGASYTWASPAPQNTYQDAYTASLTYSFHNFTSLNSFPIIVEFNYNIFWAAFRPILWIGVLSLISASVFSLSRRAGDEAETPPVPKRGAKILGSLTDALIERSELWMEIESLEKDYEEKRIRRKGFNRRRRILMQRLSSLNREIEKYERGVSRLGSDYAQQVKRLKVVEVEVQTLNREVNRLKRQLRRGRITEEGYRELREVYDERLRSARKGIEEVIKKLRGIMG